MFGDRPYEITVPQLMRAGWQKLMEFADKARQDEPRFSSGPMRRAVITYPTVAPPSVRQTIQKLLKDLRIADVRTDYDEAVASAVFYIMREDNGLRELGLESFKARSRIRGDGSWAQNVLVFDIGGGTTNVALIRLTLTDGRPSGSRRRASPPRTAPRPSPGRSSGCWFRRLPPRPPFACRRPRRSMPACRAAAGRPPGNWPWCCRRC